VEDGALALAEHLQEVGYLLLLFHVVCAECLSTNIRCKKTKKGSKKVFFLSYFGVFRRNALWYRRYMMVKKVLMGGCGKKKI